MPSRHQSWRFGNLAQAINPRGPGGRLRLSAASFLLLGIEIATSSPLWPHRRLPRRQLVTSPASSPLTTVLPRHSRLHAVCRHPIPPFNSRRAPFSPHDPTSAGSDRTEPHSTSWGDYSRRKRLHRRHFVSISRQSHQREQIPAKIPHISPQRGPGSTPSGPLPPSPGQTVDSLVVHSRT